MFQITATIWAFSILVPSGIPVRSWNLLKTLIWKVKMKKVWRWLQIMMVKKNWSLHWKNSGQKKINTFDRIYYRASLNNSSNCFRIYAKFYRLWVAGKNFLLYKSGEHWLGQGKNFFLRRRYNWDFYPQVNPSLCWVLSLGIFLLSQLPPTRIILGMDQCNSEAFAKI